MRAIAVTTLLLAATTTPAPAQHADPTAYARLGSRARLRGVTITPRFVVEDSRCPRLVACVWAGRVRLQVRISTMPGNHILELRQPYRLRGGGAVTLISVTPERETTRRERAPYRFGFSRSG